MEQVYEMILR